MSDHEYTPTSKVGKWFNDRLPLLTLANHLTDYPTPKNLNYWWTFGGIFNFLFNNTDCDWSNSCYALYSSCRHGF